MRPIALALFLALLPAVARAAPPARDHYDPLMLHAAALESIREGDVRTACILLERAARLAPHAPGIRRDLDDLLAHGTIAAARPPGAGGAGSAPQPATPEPPALWPPKP